MQKQQQQQGLMVEDEGVGLGMMGLFSTNPNSNSLASFLPHVQFDSDEALLFNYSCSSNNPKPTRHHEELLSLHQTSNSSNPWETMGMMDGDNESAEEDYDDIQEEKKKKSGMMVLGVSGVEMKKKKKKKMRKKQVREPRFSFKTLSDVDVLDDGYKWRKYGQKVVKNTHHPRSYYRCTQEKCRVKKKVERLAEDPRMVITTYEGRHAHSPAPDLHLEDQPSTITNFFFF